MLRPDKALPAPGLSRALPKFNMYNIWASLSCANCREHQALFWIKVVQKAWRSLRNRGCLRTSILSSFLSWPPPLSLTLLFRQRPVDGISLHTQLLILQVVDEQSFVDIFIVRVVQLPNRRYTAIQIMIYLRCLWGRRITRCTILRKFLSLAFPTSARLRHRINRIRDLGLSRIWAFPSGGSFTSCHPNNLASISNRPLVTKD